MEIELPIDDSKLMRYTPSPAKLASYQPAAIGLSVVDEQARRSTALNAVKSATLVQHDGKVIGLRIPTELHAIGHLEFSNQLAQWAKGVGEMIQRGLTDPTLVAIREGIDAIVNGKNVMALDNHSNNAGGVYVVDIAQTKFRSAYGKVAERSDPRHAETLFDRLLRRKKRDLVYAIAEGRLRHAMDILVAGGAGLDIACPYGDTPLTYSIVNTHTKLVADLLESGANVGRCRASGESPLALAASLGQHDLVQLLLKHGADPNVADLKGDTALHAVIPTTYVEGAARRSRENIAVLLLEHGADVNRQNRHGTTPLMRACTERAHSFVFLLKDFGVRTDLRDKQQLAAADMVIGPLRPYVEWDVNTPRTDEEKVLTDALIAAKAHIGEGDEFFSDHDHYVTKSCLWCYHWQHDWKPPEKFTAEDLANYPQAHKTGLIREGVCLSSRFEWGRAVPELNEAVIPKEIADRTCCHAWKDENLTGFLCLHGYAPEAMAHRARHPELRLIEGSVMRLRKWLFEGGVDDDNGCQ